MPAPTFMAMNSLNGLPAELKICILQQMPDLQSIQSLVLASSLYYQTYARARSQILFSLLCRHYNGEVDITESLVALRSEGVVAEDPQNRDRIIDLLDRRRRGSRAGECRTRYRHDSFRIDEIVRLLRLHDAALYFLRDFTAHVSQPPWWRPRMQGRWEDAQLVLSPTERARFFRAYYRLQTWCHIFGQPEYNPSQEEERPAEGTTPGVGNRPSENEWTDKTFTHEEAWRLIWGTMPPWEVEEVGCLLEYFMLKYIQIFQEITTGGAHGHGHSHSHSHSHASTGEASSVDAGPSSPGRAPIPSRSPIQDIYELRGDPWSLAITLRYSMIEIGPYFLYKILIRAYAYRYGAVARNLRTVFTTKLWEVTGLNDEFKLPLVSPADKYEIDNLSDVISSWPVLDRPNSAWVQRWGQGKPLHPDLWLLDSIGHFNAYPTVYRRDWKWAYVIWDNERLVEWKALI